MKRVLSTCVAIFLAGAIGIAKAEVYNPNPNGRIEILGADGVFLTSPSQVSTEGFAVRLTDPLGNPLVGIEVEFIAPALVLPPVMPPDYVPPDTRLWGRFPTGVSVSVLTDAQGIARSGPFTGGTIPGTYTVDAVVFVTFHPQNLAVFVAPPGPRAVFAVNQNFSSTPIPSLSPLMLAALATLVGAIGVWSGRLSGRRRSS